MKVGIIGGGAAGLGAAYELGLRGHTADVFESAPFLGGQASTFNVGGARLERGYHHLFTSDTAIMGLMEEIGLGGRLKWIDSNVGYFVDGRLWKFTSPIDLLKFRPLPLIDRFRLGLMTLGLQRRSEWHSLEHVTATDWLKQHAGERAYETIFAPMLRGKFGAYYDQVSMAWLWNKFALRTAARGKGLLGRFKEQLAYPVGSFGEIFDVLAERVRQQGSSVHIRSAVGRVIVEEGRERGRVGGQNSWVIDTLTEGDVLVVELFGKVDRGTFIGDNLGTAIATNTGGTGLVVDGGIRDTQRVRQLPINVFTKGLHPSAIGAVTMMEMNGPIRIGQATVLPGDVILGTSSGMISIPPQLAEKVVETSQNTRLRDYWGKMNISEGTYTPGEVDRGWSEEMEAAFGAWRETVDPVRIDIS